MGCSCHRITSTIVCNNCGTQTTISHKERLTSLEAAKRRGLKCKNCYGTDFTVQEKNEKN